MVPEMDDVTAIFPLQCVPLWVYGQTFEQHRKKKAQLGGDAVDGWNPAPVDLVNIPLFIGFHTSQVVGQISAINSIFRHQN